MAGRPSKLTPDTQRRICEAIEKGLTYAAACALAGISYETFRAWMDDASKNADSEFSAFSVAVEHANARAKELLIERVQAAANLHDVVTVKRVMNVGEDGETLVKEETHTSREWDWRAASWILERRFKSEYGASLELGKLSDAELLNAIAEGLSNLSGDGAGSTTPGVNPSESNP